MGRDLTKAQLRVLKVLYDHLGSPDQIYGGSLIASTRLPSGTTYRSLDGLEDAGLVTGTWEKIDESAEGRRARRYLEITGAGIRAYEAELRFLAPSKRVSAHA